MQESGVDEESAERHGADWYLSRNGEQLGPLTDRELSLFAEGGNFKPGDLLWTAGLDGWKPAEEIFDLAASGGASGEGGAAAAEQSESGQIEADEPETGLDAAAPADASFPIEDESERADPADDASTQTPEPETASDLESMFRAPDTAAPETDVSGTLEAEQPDPSQPSTTHLDASHLEAARDAHLGAEHLGDPHLDAMHLDPDHLDPEHLDAEHLGHPPTGEHVSALAQAISGEEPPLDFKERLIAELKKFAGTGAYLWAVFVLLGLHSWLGDAPYGPGFGFFVAMTVNAFLALQLMGFIEQLRSLRDLEHLPLIYTIAFRALVFGVLVFALYVIELTLFGLLGAAGLDLESLGGLFGTVALWIILTVAMIPYFAFRALQTTLGTETMRRLLLLRR